MTRLEALKELADKVEAGKWEFNGWADQPLDRKVMGMVDDAYHGSLDAAKALHEAVLPGWSWEGFGGELWRVWEKSNPEFNFVGLEYDTPSRAWLEAILRALIAEEELQ